MKRNLYLLVFAFVLVSSCSKKLEVNHGTPDFNAALASGNTFKAGDDVAFDFSGKADLISFYTGELYREYAFKDGRMISISNPTVSFTSAVTGGTQTNQFSVLVSTDFNGKYNDTLKAPLTDIKAATWTDITSRFALGTTATFLASGAKSLSDLVVAGKPLYVAYKYITKPQTVNGAARAWMVQTFSLTATSTVGNLTMGDMTNSGFRIVEGSTTSTTLSAVIPTRVTLQGNTFTASNDPQTETWAVSKAFNAGTIDNGPDFPIALKGVANPTITRYTYKYTKAGTYKAYFVAINANSDEQKQVIKSFDITITP